MQKSRNILFVTLTAIIVFTCCATNRGLTSKVTVSLVNYVNQGILMIAELEKKSLERYASVTGENYTNDQQLFNELTNFIIPTYKRFADGLRAITPEYEEIQRVHGIYINAADLMYNGFRNKMTGIEKNNETIIINANKDIEKARDECKRWRLELIKLYKKYGVTETGDK